MFSFGIWISSVPSLKLTDRTCKWMLGRHSYFPVYWLFHRDPYNGLLESLHNWVGFNPLYTVNNQTFFHSSNGSLPFITLTDDQESPAKVTNRNTLGVMKMDELWRFNPRFPCIFGHLYGVVTPVITSRGPPCGIILGIDSGVLLEAIDSQSLVFVDLFHLPVVPQDFQPTVSFLEFSNPLTTHGY